MTPDPIYLDGASLSYNDCWYFLKESPPVLLADSQRPAIAAAHQVVLDTLDRGTVTYGINTGFGKLSSVQIPAEDLEQLQLNLILSHAAGVGPDLPNDVARLILLLKTNNLARGYSGVRVELVDACLALLNSGAVPSIPSQGSVGASGDLAPLAHLGLILIGHPAGRVWYDDKSWTADRFLAHAGLTPVKLQAKEGLSFINGTQVSCALALKTLLHMRRLTACADMIAALSLEAFQGSAVPFDPRIHEIREQVSQQVVAARIARLLEGSENLASHANCDRVQDPYSFRCIPQVHGACLDAVKFAGSWIVSELNAVTDNPLVFPETGAILSGGNFHAEPVAFASDLMTIAATELASISERRIAQLIDPAMSGLPAFLIAEGGLNSGFMIAQVTAAALVSENKTLSHPAVVDSIPTSANKEDHVSMGTWAGRKALMAVENLESVLCIELLAACQGMEFRRPLRTTKTLEDLIANVRIRVPFMTQDRPIAPDIKVVRALLRAWSPLPGD